MAWAAAAGARLAGKQIGDVPLSMHLNLESNSITLAFRLDEDRKRPKLLSSMERNLT